jgi:transcriptional regulator NrdR family protein
MDRSKLLNFSCPVCNGDSKILDSKHRQSLGGRLRYRQCRECSHLFKTLQRPEEKERTYVSTRKASVRFTPKDILNIRNAYFKQGVSSPKLAQQYDCATTSIIRILRNQVHAHIQ